MPLHDSTALNEEPTSESEWKIEGTPGQYAPETITDPISDDELVAAYQCIS